MFTALAKDTTCHDSKGSVCWAWQTHEKEAAKESDGEDTDGVKLRLGEKEQRLPNSPALQANIMKDNISFAIQGKSFTSRPTPTSSGVTM